MQISARFAIAVHMLICMDLFKDEYKVTSEFLASSICVNPVVIRRIMQQLKSHGLIAVARGTGGAEVAKSPEEITLLDVYRAVEATKEEELFRFHEHPNPECFVGRNIHNILEGELQAVQRAMEERMESVTLKSLFDEAAALRRAEISCSRK